MSSKENVVDTTVYRDIGELNGQVSMLRERIMGIESKMDEADAKLLERLEGMQNEVRLAMEELEKKGEATSISLKLLVTMAGASATGGGIFHSVLQGFLG